LRRTRRHSRSTAPLASAPPGSPAGQLSPAAAPGRQEAHLVGCRAHRERSSHEYPDVPWQFGPCPSSWAERNITSSRSNRRSTSPSLASGSRIASVFP